MQHPLLLVPREIIVRMRMRDQDDHLRDPAALGDHQELVGQLRWRHALEPEHVAVELQRRLHVGHPQYDLGESLDPAHAAIPVIISARLASRTRGGTEQPGATSKPRPPVSSTATRTSSSIFVAGPYTTAA